jgi:pimeloyl-[acyl-carrier protein] methyl ester esterase
MDGTGDLFGPFAEALGDQFKIQFVRYAPSLAMGYSQLLAYVSQQLPENESFVLLGESFSGPIAVQLAAQHNPKLLGLVLCCTFVRNPQPRLTWLRPLISMMPFFKPPKRLLSYLLLGKRSTPALQTDLQNAVVQVTAKVMKVRLAAVLGVDVTAQMATIKVPTLYLQAKDDRLVPSSASRHICSANPKTQMVEIKGPHCLLQAEPVDAAKVVTDFIHSIRNDLVSSQLN